MRTLVLDVVPGEYSLARLPARAELSAALLDDALLNDAAAGLVSVTRTATELSVVCRSGLVPEGADVDTGWRLLSVRGPLPFTLTGIIAALASELAAAGVALFSVSTFDTDHVLVRESDLRRAVAALRSAGHEVVADE